MNLGKQALQIINTVAPTIATALGGPVAGLAVKAIQSAFGVTADKDVEAALINATPDQLAALRKIDDDFKVQMATLGFEEDKLRFDDTASARSREATVKDHTPAILAYSITVGFFAVLGYMMVYGAPATNGGGGEAFLIVLGSLGTAWAGVISYYFGSSAGSVTKDKALADIAKS